MKRILVLATAAMMAVISAQAQIKRSDEFRAKYELKGVVLMSRHNSDRDSHCRKLASDRP